MNFCNFFSNCRDRVSVASCRVYFTPVFLFPIMNCIPSCTITPVYCLCFVVPQYPATFIAPCLANCVIQSQEETILLIRCPRPSVRKQLDTQNKSNSTRARPHTHSDILERGFIILIFYLKPNKSREDTLPFTEVRKVI